ncbi:MAG: ATP-binding protein [Rhodanobacter sp.]
MNARPDRRPLPFRPAMMVAAVGLLVLAGALATAYQYHAARIEHRRQLVTQANILAASVTAAIAFDDRAAAQEYVNALKLDPRLDAAAVYNEAHRQVAGFHREGSAPIADGGSGAGDPRLVAVPARQGSTTVGRVYLRAAELPLIVQLTRYSGVVLLTIMAVLMLSALAVAQGVLTRAHASLRKRAEELVEANRRLSVEMEQRARTEEALRQSQKMEAIGQLSGGIAHDFNNLLMIIKGSLTLLQDKLLKGDPGGAQPDLAGHEGIVADEGLAVEPREARRQRISHHLEVAQESVDRATNLTQRLLSFARRQPLSPQSLQLDVLVRDMQPLLEHSVGSGVTIDYRLDACRPVLCDANQMENAILNLVVNARDAMPDGGRVTIHLDDLRIDVEHPMGGLPEGDYVRLRVIDSGTGMSEEVRGKAFDPFFTTKPVGKGTGLGLSTIFGYVVQSRGVASIDSEIGRGTTISIVLPHAPIPTTSEVA